jgi:hypothetical protein
MSNIFKLGVVPLVVLGGYSLLFYPGHDDIPEKQARHWVNDCRLVEKNIDNGFFLPSKIGFSAVMSLKM